MMKVTRRQIASYAGSIALAAAGLGISAIFYHFGAPNYTVGIAIAVVTTYSYFGFWPAVICFLASSAAVVGILVPPTGGAVPVTYEDWILVSTTSVAVIAICALIAREHRMRRRLEQRTQQLTRVTEQLAQTEQQLANELKLKTHVAETLQEAFKPDLPNRTSGFLAAATYEAGVVEAEIGGDFYDVFPMAGGLTAVVIGDVSGKGVDAARKAVMAKYTLRYLASQGLSPAGILRRLNDFLVADPEFTGFVTLLYGVYDPSTRTFTYCTGGHELPIVYRASTGTTEILKANGTLIGVVAPAEFTEDSTVLAPGDRILLYTDGLVESRGPKGMLGTEGLKKIIEQKAGMEIHAALASIVSDAREYAGGRFGDDVAAVLMEIV